LFFSTGVTREGIGKKRAHNVVASGCVTAEFWLWEV